MDPSNPGKLLQELERIRMKREVQRLRAAIEDLSSQVSALEGRLDARPTGDTKPADGVTVIDLSQEFPADPTGEPETVPNNEPDSLPDQQPDQNPDRQSDQETVARDDQPESTPSVETPAKPPEDLESVVEELNPRRTYPVGPRSERSAADLEWLVGTKGIALLGVIILVIAAGFFFKEAWDRGWIGQISGGVRCALGAVFGGLLVAAGEIVRRKINPLASSGISAAGIAIIFGSILAATRLYELLPLPVAFVLLFLTTTMGILLGALSTRVVLAALSLIGAYLVPIVLSTGEHSFVVMPAYLVAVLVIGLVLAGWKGDAFATIRRLAWWGTALLGSLWAADLPEDRVALPAAIFAGVVWLLTSIELIASARFMSKLRSKHPWTDKLAAGFLRADAGAPVTFEPRAFLEPEARWINATFGVTAWAAALAILAIRQQHADLDWIAPAALTLAGIILAVITALPPAALWRPTATPRSTLAAAFWLNAVAMLGLTIATALQDTTQVVAWIVTGLAALMFGYRARFATSTAIGLVFIAIAAARLLAYDLPTAVITNEQPAILVEVLGIVATGWSLQMLLLTAATTFAAYLLKRIQLGIIVARFAVAFAAISLVGPGSSWESVAGAWAAGAAVLILVGSKITRRDLELSGGVLLGIATLLIFGVMNDRYTNARERVEDIVFSWTPTSWALAIVSAAWLAGSTAARISPTMRSSATGIGLLCLAAAGVGVGTPIQTLLVYWAVIMTAPIAACAIKNTQGRPLLQGWLLPQLTVFLSVVLAMLWCGVQLGHDWREIAAPPLLHKAILSAVLIISTLVAAGWLNARPTFAPGIPYRDEEITRRFRMVAYAVAAGLLFAATSAELIRSLRWMGTDPDTAIGPALSIWWSLFAIATMAIGYQRRLTPARWVGLGVLIVTAGKAIFIDLAAFEGLARIAGSTVVGLLLLFVGMAYAKLNASISRTTPPSDP